MKNRKGFTLIEGMITVVIIGLILALTIPNMIAALKKEKELERLRKYGSENTMPVQQMQQQVDLDEITVTQIGQTDKFIFYRVRDKKYINEYLLVWNYVGGGISITKK